MLAISRSRQRPRNGLLPNTASSRAPPAASSAKARAKAARSGSSRAGRPLRRPRSRGLRSGLQGASRRVVREGQSEGREIGVFAVAGLLAPTLAAEPRALGIAGPRQGSRVDRECRTEHAATPTVITSATALPQGRPLAKPAE